MDPETQQTPPALEPTQPGPLESTPESMSLGFPGEEPGQDPEKAYRGLKWIFVGPQGLRAGWSILIVVTLLLLLGRTLSYVIAKLHLVTSGGAFGPRQAFFGELFQVILLTLCVAIVAAIEHRHLLDYNLRGPRRIGHFISGLVVGFAALSALVGAMAWGGWLHFGPVALQGSQIFKYAAIWGATFLLVGLFEEGSMRCYLQYTLTRGINFWWAAGPIALMCGFLIFRIKGNGAWGVYIIALLGLFPCLWLHWSKSPQSGLLAGCLAHLDPLRLRPHRQQRRELDRHLRRRVHRLRFLCQCVAHWLGMVGHRLSCRVGLGRNLFLRHSGQRSGRARPPSQHDHHGQSAVERRCRRA